MLKLLNIYQDNMVLQRDKEIKIAGFSDISEQVRVVLKNKTLFDSVIQEGNFLISLPKQNKTYNTTLKIESPSTNLIYKNVNIGEVWIAGGQSNMEFPLKFDTDAKDILDSFDNKIRFYDVTKNSFKNEELDGFLDTSYTNKWLDFNPTNSGNFSAVGAYFSIKLYESLDCPIGIIGCNYGGTSLFTWLDENYMNEPELLSYLNNYKKAIYKLDKEKYHKLSYKSRALISSKEMKTMNDNMLSGGKTSVIKTIKAIPKAFKVISYTMTKGPNNPNCPGNLFNNMIKEIVPYTCKGFIFYQGETDSQHRLYYDKLFLQLIKCYRDIWNDELPFLCVELAPYKSSQMGSGKHFSLIREKQELVSHILNNVHLLSIMDLGEKNNIHPRNKQKVGNRLSLIALKNVYNFDIVSGNPKLIQAYLSNNNIILEFDNVGERLYVEGNFINDLQITIGKKIIKKYDFKIDNNKVIIGLNKIKENSIIKIVLAKTPYANVNIYNSANFPVKPFSITITKIDYN
jgi:sialate O-acetylesterase